MTTLEEKLGYEFRDPALLENALTHSSCANESRGRRQSNERLEFLGDSILGMVVADHLYRNHPDLPEGELSEDSRHRNKRQAWTRARIQTKGKHTRHDHQAAQKRRDER